MLRTLLWMIILAIASNAQAEVTRHVMVLHSYHQGWEWSDHITSGIQSVFAPFQKDISVNYEYLDLDSQPSEEYLESLAAFYSVKLKKNRPDVLIVAGGGALQFVRHYVSTSTKDTPVVFCGIDTYARATDGSRETGVLAQLDHQATFSLMLRQHPACRRIYCLVDKTNVDLAFLAMLDSLLAQSANKVSAEIWQTPQSEELPAKLLALDPQDLIYLLAFDPDQSASATRSSAYINEIRRWSPAAAYSPLEFYLDKGIVGGRITSGFRQGETAAQMALRILSGDRVQDIAVVTQSPNDYVFDGRALNRRGISTARLPAGSRILHPPPRFWARQAIWLLVLGAGLLMAALLFWGLIMRQKQKQQHLSQLNVELDSRIREKTVQLQLANQKLKKKALTDPLTGLLNRRSLIQRLAEEIKKARRYEYALTIILLDIDQFKKVNEAHGYAVGDKVLRDVGQAIRNGARDIDLVGRYGGEEFLVILPNTDNLQALNAAERIRRKVSLLRWEQPFQVVLSGGLAQLDDHSPAGLIQAAGVQLLTAKSCGGNRMAGSQTLQIRSHTL